MKFTVRFFYIFLISTVFFSSAAHCKVFELENLQYFDSKEKVSLDKKNKIFVLFWATWCTTCKVKITEKIPKMKKQYANVTFLALNIDKDKNRVKHYIQKNGIAEQIVSDPTDVLLSSINNNVAPYWAVFDFSEKKKSWVLTKKESGFELSNISNALKIAGKKK